MDCKPDKVADAEHSKGDSLIIDGWVGRSDVWADPPTYLFSIAWFYLCSFGGGYAVYREWL